MAGSDAEGNANVIIQARVFRCAHDKRPWFIPTRAWNWLAKKRVPGTGRWENLGVVASSEQGTATLKPSNQ